jgi:hypothetical protein
MNLWLYLANAVLLVHACYAIFVVAGALLIPVGGVLGWRWVRNFWFRLGHLLAIAIVALETLAGWDCPLTTLESVLRIQGGQIGYQEGFLTYWARNLLFCEEIPQYVFDAGHCLCAIWVGGLWLLWPPRPSPVRSNRVPPVSPEIAPVTKTP